MKQRKSKTPTQQERYYKVEDIYTYMLSTYANGNFEHLRRLYMELKVKYRKEFIMFVWGNAPYKNTGEILSILL